MFTTLSSASPNPSPAASAPAKASATHPPPRRRWLAPVLLLMGLLPTAMMGLQAVSLSDSMARESRWERRKRILAAIPNDAAVLINIEYRDMPASPDILNLGKRSTKALERCLADNVDANNRASCAVVLEALGDRGALPTLRAALEDWDDNVRVRVVSALGAMPDRDSVAPLMKLFKRKDESYFVRAKVLHALGSISDKRVVKLLRDELRARRGEGDDDMRAEAYAALWQNRHLMARTTLVADTRAALTSDDNDALVLAATHAAAELRSPRLVAALIPLMEHQSSEVRNKAVYALGRIGDKKATKALLARLPKVRESRMLNNISFALERLDKDAFYASIKKVIQHKQAIIRLNAAFVLGDVKRPEGLPMLEQALNDPSDYVRTSAIVAVGKLGTSSEQQTKRAISALEPFAQHPNLSVREEAIYALHKLTKGGRKDLIYNKLFKIPSPRRHRQVVHRAAMELGKANDPRMRQYITECLLSGSCAVREVETFFKRHSDEAARGRMMLQWAQGHEHFTGLISELNPEGTLPVAKAVLREAWRRPQSSETRSSLKVLGAVGDSTALELARRRENVQLTWTRLRAQVAQARLGDEAAAERLVVELTNLPTEWLPSYARLLQGIGEAAAHKALGPKLEAKQTDNDVDIALAAAAIRLAYTPEAAIFRFVAAMGSASAYERNLAERYLKKNRSKKVTWLLRRALAREGREDVKDRLRALVEQRN